MEIKTNDKQLLIAENTLKKYYSNLPARICPKTEFIRQAALLTGKQEAAIRLWVHKGVRPCSDEDRKVISRLTGIAEEFLWPEK